MLLKLGVVAGAPAPAPDGTKFGFGVVFSDGAASAGEPGEGVKVAGGCATPPGKPVAGEVMGAGPKLPGARVPGGGIRAPGTEL